MTLPVTAIPTTPRRRSKGDSMKHTEHVVNRLKEEGLLQNIAIRVGRYDAVLGEWYSEGIDSKTLFDMASVTKIMATTTLALLAIDAGELKTTDPISKFFPVPQRYEPLTVWHLLTHTSGIGGRDLRGEGITYRNIAAHILSLEGGLVGSEVVYSCPSFILLGKVLETVYQKPLDVLFREKIAQPLGMTRSGFCPGKAADNLVNSNLEHEKRGMVNDYNCQFLGGVAGNAGLFSNVEEITLYVRTLLNTPFLSKTVLDAAARNHTPGMAEARGLGFVYVDERYRQTGTLFPVGTIGHCGHTGQSVFFNRESGCYAIILSDATISTTKKYGSEHYDEVIQIRETLHNAIKEDLKMGKKDWN